MKIYKVLKMGRQLRSLMLLSMSILISIMTLSHSSSSYGRAQVVKRHQVRVFLGTTSNPQELGDTKRYQLALDTGRVGLFVNGTSTYDLLFGWTAQGGSRRYNGEKARDKVLTALRTVGTSLYEGGFSPFLTPHVCPSKSGLPQCYSTSDGKHDYGDNAFYTSSGFTQNDRGRFQTWYALGFRPTFYALDISFNGPQGSKNYLTEDQTAWSIAALQDLKNTTGVTTIFPYLNGNGGHWSDEYVKDPELNFSNSPYYGSVRRVISIAGAVAIDIPPSMVFDGHRGGRSTTGRIAPYPMAYLLNVLGEIRWARSCGFKIMIYVSPFQVGRSGSPQFGYDPDFYENTFALVAYLIHSGGKQNPKSLLPDYWQVGQYSNSDVTNTISDVNDHESVSSIAYALAKNLSSTTFTGEKK